MYQAAQKVLEDYFAEAHLEVTPRIVEQFDVYTRLLVETNERTNLIGPFDALRIVEELFCDSLRLLQVVSIPDGAWVLDVGSGAGFPGLPLKIVQPSILLRLVEPRRHRNAFLGLVARELELENVERLSCKIEDLPPTPHALVCSKAFLPVEHWPQVAAPFCGEQGIIGVLGSLQEWERCAPALGLGERFGMVERVDYRTHTGGKRVAVALSVLAPPATA